MKPVPNPLRRLWRTGVFRKRAGTAKLRRVLPTDPRSGTHYLKFLLSAALGNNPVQNDSVPREALESALSSIPDNHLLYGYFRFSKHPELLDQLPLRGAEKDAHLAVGPRQATEKSSFW